LFDTVSEFLSNSYRNVVVVYFIKHMQILPRAIHAAIDSDVKFGNESIKDCTDTAKDKGLSHQVEKLLAQELVFERKDSNSSDDKFRVAQVFCVKKDTPISLIQLRDYVLKRIHGHQVARGSQRKLNVSILFISWQGRFTHTFTDLNIMNKCKFSGYYSNKVLDFATQFIHSLNLHEASYISVHIRFEHLFMHHRADPEKFNKCCMKELKILLSAVHQEFNVSSNRTLVVTDYGAFGSDTCRYDGYYTKHSLCVENTTKLLSEINITSAKFDPLAFGAPDQDLCLLWR